MNRLQKKCIIASAGFHLLLALILLIGPAFISSKNPPPNLPVLDYVPFRTVDALMSGGGRPDARPLPPAPPAVREATPEPPAPPPPKPFVKPQPKPEPEPEAPIKEAIKEFKEAKTPKEPDPESFELSKKPKKTETTPMLVRHRPDPQAAAKAAAKAQAEAEEQAEIERKIRQYTDSRRRAARAFGNAVDSIDNRPASGSTKFELKGPGGGGVPYANFNQSVISVYTRAWIVPDGVTDKDATVETIVVIGRDGTVLSYRITQRSGIPELDRSVQRVLERVKHAAPLPDDAPEDRREVPINFNATIKPSIG